jgi:hypothetical protein
MFVSKREKTRNRETWPQLLKKNHQVPVAAVSKQIGAPKNERKTQCRTALKFCGVI